MIGTQQFNNMYNANTDANDREDLAGVLRSLMRHFFTRKILATSTLKKPGGKGKVGKDKTKNQVANKKEPLNPKIMFAITCKYLDKQSYCDQSLGF